MRFLADMGVSKRVVGWLRHHGHDAVHLQEEGLHCLPNGAIFDKAIAEGRVVVAVEETRYRVRRFPIGHG